MEDVAPHALGSPALEAVVERLPRPVDLWRIDPAPAASDDMDDAADHAAVINARFASRIGRKVRLKPRELRIRQPEKVLFHQPPPSGDRESRNAKAVYGSGP